MGNTTVWKPASAAVLSGWYLMKIFKEAGLPDGVINFIPGSGSLISSIVLRDRDLGGIHFTVSNATFNTLWKQVSENLENYRSYPKIVGETGGNGDKTHGYFVEPTIILTTDPHFITMEEEIFGPVMTIYLYNDDKYEETLRLCDETSPFGLTGAIFSSDKYAILKACRALRYAAGNFYINDKPTGAMVGQQPFGGSRASGTNDKAGSYLNLLRWVSPRTVKEALIPDTDYRYPYMEG